jgi:hypothetical protein
MKPEFLLLLLLAAPSLGQSLAPERVLSPVGHSTTQSNELGPPMSFELNCGQVPHGIDFVARGRGYSSFLGAGRATLRLNRFALSGVSKVKPRADVEVGINLVNANSRPDVRPEDKLLGRSNYLFGTDPGKWITIPPARFTLLGARFQDSRLDSRQRPTHFNRLAMPASMTPFW